MVHETSPVEREKIIRAARFPPVNPVVQYQESKRLMRQFLASDRSTTLELENARDRFISFEESETNPHRALRFRLDHQAISAFLDQLSAQGLDMLQVVSAPADLSLPVEAVNVKTRLDAEVLGQSRYGAHVSGGLMIFSPQSEAARKNVQDRLQTMAALIHWTLTVRSPNREAKPGLCRVWDLSSGEMTPSKPTYSRLQGKVEATCREVAARWLSVPPPPDYDGPNP